MASVLILDRCAAMIVFLDTEFTDLHVFSRLLSIGIVGGGRVEDDFYAEVTDDNRLEGASAFASHRVLPQFGRVVDAACPYLEIGRRLCAFFARQIDRLPAFESLEVAYEYDLDWSLTRLAMEDAGKACWKRLEGRLRPRNIYGMPGFMAGEGASDRYFEAQRLEPLSRHHALCDARALRIGYEAARVSSPEQQSRPRGGSDFRQVSV